MNMKRWISAALLSLLCRLLRCGCAPGPINDGETYLDGAWYFSDPSLGLNVGYNFFPDGGGYQFIGSTVNPIRYGVYEGNIYIAVGDGPADSFSFEQKGDTLVIGGLEYLYAPEDESGSQSVGEDVSATESVSSDPLAPGGIAFYVIAVIAFGLVIFILIWVVRTFRKKN